MTRRRLSVRVEALAVIVADRWPSGSEARLVDQLVDRLPRTIAQLAMATPDGYPSTSSGAPDRGGSASTGSTDRLGDLVARRAAAADDYTRLGDLVGESAACAAVGDRQGVRRALERALGVTDVWQPPASPSVKAALSCARWTATDSGVDAWVDPLCERIADAGRAGLCEACWRRRHRWAQRRATVSG